MVGKTSIVYLVGLPWVDVRLAALEVVVQVVSEQVDQVDGVVPGLGGSVTREEDEGDVAHTLPGPGIGVLQT